MKGEGNKRGKGWEMGMVKRGGEGGGIFRLVPRAFLDIQLLPSGTIYLQT